MAFFKIEVYNTGLSAFETKILGLDPASVQRIEGNDTALAGSSKIIFSNGNEAVVNVDFEVLSSRVNAVEGVLDLTGTLL